MSRNDSTGIARFVIYCHTCVPTGKKYVGQTRCRKPWLDAECAIQERWRRHYPENDYLSAAIAKYGEDAFAHEVLIDFVGSQDDANKAEIEWIARVGCRAPVGFNFELGGGVGPKHEKSRQKMRDRWTPERRAQMSAASKSRWAALTKTERSELCRQRAMKVPPEIRREIAVAASAVAAEKRKANPKLGCVAVRVVKATRRTKLRALSIIRCIESMLMMAPKAPKKSKAPKVKLSKEMRSVIARESARKRLEKMLPDRLSEIARERDAAMGHEGRSARAVKANASRPLEQRRASARKGVESRTSEQRSASVRAGRASMNR